MVLLALTVIPYIVAAGRCEPPKCNNQAEAYGINSFSANDVHAILQQLMKLPAFARLEAAKRGHADADAGVALNAIPVQSKQQLTLQPLTSANVKLALASVYHGVYDICTGCSDGTTACMVQHVYTLRARSSGHDAKLH